MFRRSCFAIGLGLTLSCVAALEAHAQAPAPTPAPRSMQTGGRVGPAFSWMTFNEDNLDFVLIGEGVSGRFKQQAERYLGASGGVHLSYAFRPEWGVEARVLLASQGSTLRGTGELSFDDEPDLVGFVTVITTYRTFNMNVPVLARVSFGAPKGRFYVGGGPEFAFVISARREERLEASIQGEPVQVTQHASVDIGDDMKTSTVGLMAVGGWESGGSRFRGFFEFGYVYGLGSLFVDNPSDRVSLEVQGDDVRHRGLTIMFGAAF